MREPAMPKMGLTTAAADEMVATHSRTFTRPLFSLSWSSKISFSAILSGGRALPSDVYQKKKLKIQRAQDVCLLLRTEHLQFLKPKTHQYNISLCFLKQFCYLPRLRVFPAATAGWAVSSELSVEGCTDGLYHYLTGSWCRLGAAGLQRSCDHLHSERM